MTWLVTGGAGAVLVRHPAESSAVVFEGDNA